MNAQMKHVALATAVLILSGCGTVNKEVRRDIDQLQRDRKPALEKPLTLAPQSRVSEVRGNFMPVSKVQSPRQNEWLRLQSVSLDIRNPTPLTAVVSMLANQGINLSSDLPLNSYSYVGKVNATDGETALKAVLGSVGLDYQVDDKRKLVVIKPMASRSWFINIGNRKSSYSSDVDSSSSGQGTGNAQSSNATGSMSGNSQNAAGMGSSNSMGMSGSGSTTSGSTNGSTNSSNSSSTGTGVAAHDDFWQSLSVELTNRLSVMLPRSMAQPANSIQSQQVGLPGQPAAAPTSAVPIVPTQYPGAMGNPQSLQGTELYLKRQIGSFSLNPETGSITVQAPHWVLTDMDLYLKRVQEMYNTDISFMGEVVMVTSNRSDSEGFNITALTKWAGGKYGAVVSNNALGGITMSLPTAGATGSVQAAAQSVAGPLLGMTYSGAANALDIFNAYLSELGKVSVIQRPLVTTTSGVPGVFSKKYTDYYNTVSQQAASGGTGSAATATQNVLVPVELGTELRINPRIDISTGLIRAQLTLNQAIKSGSKTVPQTITFGDKTSSVNTTIPLITKQHIGGEILLRDGDLVVVGGQTEDNSSADENGLPGMDGPLGGFLGVKKATRGTQTYYFALRVSVNKRQ